MDLMPQLIDFLKENPNAHNIESSLDFLKGKKSYLPPGFPTAQEQPAGVSKIFEKLFATQVSLHRTIENFEELWDAIRPLTVLEEWAKSDDCPIPGDHKTKMNLIDQQVKRYQDRHDNEIPDCETTKQLSKQQAFINWRKAPSLSNDAITDRMKIASRMPNMALESDMNLNGFEIHSLAAFEGAPGLQRLKRMSLIDNRISSFAETPQMQNLEILNLNNNPITSFDGMTEMRMLKLLSLDNSLISTLDAIPVSMLNNSSLTISLNGCPLRPATMHAINAGSFNGNPIQARIRFNMVAYESINNGYPILSTRLTGNPEVSELLKQLKEQAADDYEFLALKTLLGRLPMAECFQGARASYNLNTLLNILKTMVSHQPFREFCFVTCGGSDSDCYDHVQEIFTELHEESINPAYRESSSLQDVVDYQRKHLHRHLLSDFVVKMTGDLLESGMFIKKKLSENYPDAFPLSEYDEIKHPREAEAHKDIEGYKLKAKEYIIENATDDRLIRQLAENSSFISFIEKLHPEKYAQFSQEWGNKYEELEERSEEGNAKNQNMEEIAKELKTIQNNVFSSTSFASKEALNTLYKKLSHTATGMLIREMQEVAKKVWAREMAEQAVNDCPAGEQWKANNLHPG